MRCIKYIYDILLCKIKIIITKDDMRAIALHNI